MRLETGNQMCLQLGPQQGEGEGAVLGASPRPILLPAEASGPQNLESGPPCLPSLGLSQHLSWHPTSTPRL